MGWGCRLGKKSWPMRFREIAGVMASRLWRKARGWEGGEVVADGYDNKRSGLWWIRQWAENCWRLKNNDVRDHGP